MSVMCKKSGDEAETFITELLFLCNFQNKSHRPSRVSFLKQCTEYSCRTILLPRGLQATLWGLESWLGVRFMIDSNGCLIVHHFIPFLSLSGLMMQGCIY